MKAKVGNQVCFAKQVHSQSGCIYEVMSLLPFGAKKISSDFVQEPRHHDLIFPALVVQVLLIISSQSLELSVAMCRSGGFLLVSRGWTMLVHCWSHASPKSLFKNNCPVQAKCIDSDKTRLPSPKYRRILICLAAALRGLSWDPSQLRFWGKGMNLRGTKAT